MCFALIGLILCIQPSFSFLTTSTTPPPHCKVHRSIFPSLQSTFDGNDDKDMDMDKLNERINTDPYSRLFATREWELRAKPKDVFVIVFKQDTEDEGVHSIEYPLGSGKNSVLGFESAQECILFAKVLKEMEFFDPTVSAWRSCVQH